MRNVKLSFLLVFFLLSCQGYADCPPFVESNTWWEAIAGGSWVKEIKVKAIKDQGVEGYFNPKIRVCAFDGKSYCYDLHSGTSCQKIYGTQKTGAGVSAEVFIDWEGDKTQAGGEFAKGLGWEWADDVTDEEKVKFTNSPKICACSQKGACMSGISSWGARVFSGENIFRPGEMEKVCDTCYQTKVKCAPVPLAPGPPPFCEQLAMSPPQVRIVPITNKKKEKENDPDPNDYFHPKVKVIAGDIIDAELSFPKRYGKDKFRKQPIWDIGDTMHYFITYREKDRLCTEYHGTGKKSERKLQFPARCFPEPPAPEIEEVSIPKPEEGKGENTLKVKIRMSENVCTRHARGTHNNGVCTFYVNANSPTYIGHLPLKVVKPAIVKKTARNGSNIDNIIEGILKNNSQFEVLEKYGYVPDIEAECKESQNDKCKLDDSGYPKIEIRYKKNPKSKMLCLSGWQPEPEEFVLEKGSDLMSLKSMGANYAKYNTVYSKESNQSYYFPCNETVDVLAKSQDELNEIIFNKKGYVSILTENKDRGSCIARKNDEIKTKQNCDSCKIVYELTNGKHEEKCEQSDDGCLCFDGVCSRLTQYMDKDDKPFHLRVSQDENGVVKKLDQPMKANRTEVFFADKLCKFDLQNVKEKVLDTIKKRSESKNLPQHYKFSGDNNYTSDLSKYGYIEIEIWGGGEAGHIKDEARSTENRPGIPGDYIKVQLKVDPEYPIIKAKATEGGGGLISHISNKDGGPTWIEMCNSRRQDCKPLITVAGGGVHKRYGGQEYKKTKIHDNLGKLKVLRNPIVIEGKKFTGNNQIAYIRDGEIKLEAVQCSSASNNQYGAGGCINTNSKIYGRGSPGYVMIRSIKIDYEEVQEIINTLVENPDSNSVSDLIKELYPDIIKEIKEEIRKELLGL